MQRLKEEEQNKISAPQDRLFHHPWTWTIGLLPVLLTSFFYLPVLKNNFVNWDDAEVIQENIHIRYLNLDSLHWMFTTFLSGNWIPLTWLSFAVDYRLGGLNPLIYHLDNLVLHGLNTLVVFFLSLKLLGRMPRQETFGAGQGILNWKWMAAFLTAILFGLHPIHTKSVAWATERKDLLSGFFFFTSLWVYLDYAANKKNSSYLICLGLFLLALLSKPMAVTLPLVLLLLDFYPLERLSGQWTKRVLEKIPFWAASLLSGWITIIAQSQSKAFSAMDKLPMLFRISNAFHSVDFYLAKMFIPLDLAAFYPLPPDQNIFSIPYLASDCW